MYTRTPVVALAWYATSGTPRVLPMVVLPLGSVFWKLGLAKTLLKPPPESIQPTSRTPGLLMQRAGGSVLSTPVPVFGFTHRYVPPTLVTSGSDAGHSTDGNGIVCGLFTGCFMALAVPLSPDEPRTVMLAACAEINAWRRFIKDCVLPNAPSADAKLCEITEPSRWSTTYCSASIIVGKPWTPSVSAVGVVTSRMLAPGATECAHSTSNETSSA